MQIIHQRYALCPIIVFTVLASISLAQVPDRPIITEVYFDPSGNDGPTGRNPANPHQEFIEIYLPNAASLNPSLNKDALRLTFYDIEGDSGNSQRGYVNQRFDLPAFDFDSSNGITPGAVARPSSGVVVLGWVDYDATVTDLAGTPSTRLGLINGGITTSPPGVLFIAMNGAEFTGTTNFPVPAAESLIDVFTENSSGILPNGSNAYLLVNRDSPGYVQLEDRKHPELGPSNASLPGGSVLGLSSLLDGIAGNDDPKFSVTAQPYVSPTGRNIDLEDVLPSGGVFSVWVAQISKSSGVGYARTYVDRLRTTEDAAVGNENPATDAQNVYRQDYNTGPFYPSPGIATFSTDPPQLAVAQSTRHTFSVIAGTTGRPGLISANIGGDYPIGVTATPGASSNPSVATFTTSFADPLVLGQTDAYPQIAVAVPIGAADGATAFAPITFDATKVNIGDPAVVNPTQASTATVTALNPARGLDGSIPAQPFETTVFLAVQGFGADPAVVNEFLSTSLAAFVTAHLDQSVQDGLGHIHFLLQPATNLEDYLTMSGVRLSFPATTNYINKPGPSGHFDLVETVGNCAEAQAAAALLVSSAYAGSFNSGNTALKAIEIAIPETRTKGGAFTPSEYLFFVEPNGDVYNRRSGLSWVTTTRTFELALFDTNVTSTGLESGDADDLGLIVEVGRVRPGASVVPGQFVFLSYSGGLQGEDIDTLDLPGPQATNAILLDLDNLDDVLGCETVTRVFVIDGDGNGVVDIIEALSLNADQPSGPTCGNGVCVAPENSCNCPSDCGQPPTTELVCNDGTDNDCDGLTDCADGDCTESFACAGPNCGNSSCDPPETICNCPSDCAPPGPPPAPTADPSGIDKSRFISLVPGNAGQCTAIRVTLSSLHHVVPPYTVGASAPFTAFEGQVRWVGPAKQYFESGSSGVSFFASQLICTPYYQDWSTIGLLHVTGSAVVPSSVYQVAILGAACQGAESSCSAVSSSLQIQTSRWGDAVINGIANFADISALVSKFQSKPGAPIKARAKLAGDAWGLIAITPNVGFGDIAAAVNAFKGLAYPYIVAGCP